MKLSSFGTRMTAKAGILSLMDDLGRAMAGDEKMIMMGGGNPGRIAAVQEILRRRLLAVAADPHSFDRLIGIYDPPEGKREFNKALAAMLRRNYGWPVSAENICLTNGSQASFFLLFNMLAGRFDQGAPKKILLPLAPEYIGYADLGLSNDFFTAVKPRIEFRGDQFFKYRVDFDNLNIAENIGALCVSRPTNPTGNVLTDDEISRLAALARNHAIPLIIDNAYGVPFPGIVYTRATPIWDDNLIVCMSLSKFGLPSARTGIVIARAEIIRSLAAMNAILNLAPTGFGPGLTLDLIADDEILTISRKHIRPFYETKMKKALAVIAECFKGLACRIHVPEGAMFLWLWFPDLPVTSNTLYQRLKQRGVLVVSGHFFFPGLQENWNHRHQCLRITYSQDDDDVARGLRIISDEIRRIV